MDTQTKEYKIKQKYYLLNFEPLLFLMIFILIDLIKTKSRTNLNYYSSKIHLVIKGSGNQKILSSDFSLEPSQVIVNGITKTDSCKKICNLDKNYNNITLIFDYQIETCNSMFDGLRNITEIDLSNFDASKVTDFHWMFSTCSGMQKITFGNIDTSLVENMASLFTLCSQLTSVDLSHFKTSKVKTMYNMFSDCSNLEIINFGNIDTSLVTNMQNLFNCCSKLKVLNLSSFVTSNVETMEQMFAQCSSLKYLDLSNFDTTKVTTITYMFDRCSSLIFLNLYSFQLKSNVNKNNAFDQISSTVKYCIHDINTKNYILGNNIISNCSDICFNKNSIIDINNNKCLDPCSEDSYIYKYNNTCFIECPKDTYPLFCDGSECNNNKRECFDKVPQGYYLDINNNVYKECFEKCKSCFGQGTEGNHNCKECNPGFIFLNDSLYKTNCYEKCDFYYYFDEFNDYHCTEICKDNYNKLIKNKNKCIDKCENDNIYKYEYNNTCYLNCPHNTIVKENNNYICLQISHYSTMISKTNNHISLNTHNNYQLITTLINKEDFTHLNTILKEKESDNIINDFDLKTDNTINSKIQEHIYSVLKVITSNETINFNNSDLEIQDKVLEKILEIFDGDFDTTSIDNGNDIQISFDKINYTLTTTSNQKSNENLNVSTIDLGECEIKLKEKYNISQNDDLYIIKIDALVDNIHKIEYDVYYQFSLNNLTKLNLSICKDVKIDLFIPAEISLNEIDKYNKSSDLYNDICYTLTSESGTDKPIKDRQNEFVNNNMSICEEDCDFADYDNKRKKALCSCYTKIKIPLISEIKVDKKKLLSNFKDIKNIGNFNILKCIYLLYDFNNFTKNSANYILIILFILSLFSIFSFICCNIKKVNQYINKFYQPKNKNRISDNNKKISKQNNKKTSHSNNDSGKKRNNHQRKEISKIGQIKNINFKSGTKLQLNKRKLINNNNKYKNELSEFKERCIKLNKNINKKSSTNKYIKRRNLIKNKIGVKAANIKKISKNIILYNDNEMNSLIYKKAKEKDKRTYCQYYLSLLRTKHILIFTFFYFNDYNSQIIKIYIFFLTFTINYAVSAMFYSDSTMHKIYLDEGSFDFTYQLPKMFYSLIISSILKAILNFLGLYEENIIAFKNIEPKNLSIKRKLLFNIKFKISLFFIMTYILIVFIWIYLGCFCAVYKNTQIHLLLDVSSSFCLSFITPFFIYLIPGIFRMLSLRKKVERPLMFKFSQLLQLL